MTKPRVQVDAFVIGVFMLIVGILVLKFPGVYLEGPAVRGVFDVVGFVVIIIGALLRMSARGFKKFSSQQGGQLVTGGPYKLVRNPMYLGTFLVGVGFMCPLYPLWTIVIFTVVFYWRFRIQIKKEEQWLKQSFTDAYDDYCRRVPAFLPNARSIQSVSLQDVFPWKHLWTTKEKYGLFYWPLLSVALELLQERFLFKSVNLIPIAVDVVIAIVFLIWMLRWSNQEEGYVR